MIRIDTGDSVFHRPSREWWSVAYVEDGKLCACGWPLGFVPVSTCLLVTKATIAERDKLLYDMADMKRGDPRHTYAAARLARMVRDG